MCKVVHSPLMSAAEPAPLDLIEQRRQADEEWNRRLFSQVREADRLYANGDYRGALKLYELLGNERLRSDCGNTNMDWRFELAMRKAVPLEHLGRYAEAVELYFTMLAESNYYPDKTAPSRLAALYSETRQTADLTRMLDDWEKPLLVNASTAEETRPSRTVRELLAVHDLAGAGRWNDLFFHFLGATVGVAPEEAVARGMELQAVEAARVLARHPRESLPLLRQRLADPRGLDLAWIYYTLGLMRTPEAISLLRQGYGRDYGPARATIVYALSIASPAVLRQLKRTGDDTTYIDAVLARLERQQDFVAAVPAVPRGVKLPVELAVLTKAG
jgi:tetratricopeptide (TPR) repeat protein